MIAENVIIIEYQGETLFILGDPITSKIQTFTTAFTQQCKIYCNKKKEVMSLLHNRTYIHPVIRMYSGLLLLLLKVLNFSQCFYYFTVRNMAYRQKIVYLFVAETYICQRLITLPNIISFILVEKKELRLEPITFHTGV